MLNYVRIYLVLMTPIKEFQQNAIRSLLRETYSSAEDLNPQNILSKRLSELNIESLTFMEIIMNFEEELEIEVQDEDLSGDPTTEAFLKKIYERRA